MEPYKDIRKDIGTDLDETKLKRLKYQIFFIERENLKTRELNNDQMVEKIRKLIKEEVDKCY